MNRAAGRPLGRVVNRETGESRVFECGNCKNNRWPLVMLTDELWATIAKRDELLCPNCIEMRLGRVIMPDDLMPGHPVTLGLQIGFEIFSRRK